MNLVDIHVEQTHKMMMKEWQIYFDFFFPNLNCLLFIGAAQKGFCPDREISISAKIHILWVKVGILAFQYIQMSWQLFVWIILLQGNDVLLITYYLSLAVVCCTAILQGISWLLYPVAEEGGSRYIRCFSSSFQILFWYLQMLQDECRQLLSVFQFLCMKCWRFDWWWRHYAFVWL